MWFKKRRQKRAEKNCILSWDLTAAGSKRQNLAFLTKMLLLNNLCMILPRYWTVFQKKEAKILKVFIWEIMIKRILWYAFKSSHIMKYSREPALIIQLKFINGLHLNHTLAFCTYLMFSVLKDPPPPPSVLNAFFFDKTLCLVIITYLWSQFRNLTFCFWFVIYSSVCYLVIECHFAFLPESELDFCAIRKEIEFLSDLFYLLFLSDEDVPNYFCIVIRA